MTRVYCEVCRTPPSSIREPGPSGPSRCQAAPQLHQGHATNHGGSVWWGLKYNRKCEGCDVHLFKGGRVVIGKWWGLCGVCRPLGAGICLFLVVRVCILCVVGVILLRGEFEGMVSWWLCCWVVSQCVLLLFVYGLFWFFCYCFFFGVWSSLYVIVVSGIKK